MCDGCDFSLSSGTSMFKMRSGVEVAPAGGGRRRRYTSKRLWDDGLEGASMVGGAVANRWMDGVGDASSVKSDAAWKDARLEYGR